MQTAAKRRACSQARPSEDVCTTGPLCWRREGQQRRRRPPLTQIGAKNLQIWAKTKERLYFLIPANEVTGHFRALYYIIFYYNRFCVKLFSLYSFQMIEPPSTSHLKGEPVLLQRFNDELVKSTSPFLPFLFKVLILYNVNGNLTVELFEAKF